MSDRHDVGFAVEDDGARAGCPLIQRENVQHPAPSEMAAAATLAVGIL
jgi:hypothetical protein